MASSRISAPPVISSATTTLRTWLFSELTGRATTTSTRPRPAAAGPAWRAAASRSTARSRVPSGRVSVNGWWVKSQMNWARVIWDSTCWNWRPSVPGVSSTICPVRREIRAAR